MEAEQAKVGRPTILTPELADKICDRMIEGESLIQICDDPGMPSRATVYRWMDADRAFETRCARAREGQADFMDHKILTTADSITPETAAADRVKISAYQWRASKLSPRRYGDKVAVVGGGPGDRPIRLDVHGMTPDQLASEIAALEAEAAAHSKE